MNKNSKLNKILALFLLKLFIINAENVQYRIFTITEYRKKNSGNFRQTEPERRQQRLRDIPELFGITDQPANNLYNTYSI